MPVTPLSLRPPLHVAWHAHTNVIINSITAHDDVIVVAARKELIGLDARTGTERWRRPARRPIGLMPVTSRGPVACSFEKGITELDAFDWEGKPRWSLRRDWFFPGDGIRSEDSTILCAGRYEDDGRLICAYVDDATGKVKAELPCDGVEPHGLPGALLYRNDAAGEWAGLFRLDHATGKVTKLSSLEVHRYAVAGDVAVVNAGEPPSEVVAAIDIANGNVRWSVPGTVSCDLVIDGDELFTGIGDDDNYSVISRSLRDGSERWAAPPVPRILLRPIIVTPTLVVAFGAEDGVDLHDRESGRLVQRLETFGGYAGGVVTTSGLIDVRRNGEVVCWRGA